MVRHTSISLQLFPPAPTPAKHSFKQQKGKVWHLFLDPPKAAEKVITPIYLSLPTSRTVLS